MAHNVSVAQLSSLIDFLEAHPDLALGRCIRTKEGRSLAKRLWAECAGTLNSVSADCAQKSADQWRVYYNEYKSKLLKKIKLEKVEKNATGGGQAASINLTPLQERLYSILGRDVGEPLPNVRHLPVNRSELLATFDCELAYRAYSAFEQLVGQDAMARCLSNGDNIRELCREYVARQRASSPFQLSSPDKRLDQPRKPIDISPIRPDHSPIADQTTCSNSFGSNVTLVGNRIEINDTKEGGHALGFDVVACKTDNGTRSNSKVMRFLSLVGAAGVRRGYWREVSRRLLADSTPQRADGAAAAREQAPLDMSPPLLQFSPSWPPSLQPALRARITHCMRVLPEFVTAQEEQRLMAELEPKLKRMRYEYDHWDDAIHGYKETEHGEWQPENAAVMTRVRGAAFEGGEGGGEPLTRCHVLDLAPAGHIKPHIDAVRYCGRVIAGLCLLSSAVMRLQHSQHPQLVVDALLPQRGLYIMTGEARYDFTHAVVSNECSEWRGQRVVRRRRVAVITRSRPPPPDGPGQYTSGDSDSVQRTRQ